jgi:N,N'-diacetyllegionaminate synthase
MFRNYRPDRCYVIAEIGGNFTTLDEAAQLIDGAAECQVDAVKLQTYRADTIASKRAVFDMENTGRTSQHALFKKYEIDEDVHRGVFAYAAAKGLDWFSTPSHEDDVALLERLGAAVYKIGSDDAVNLQFLRYVARTGKPIILSTGMCTMDEVREAVDTILQEGNDRIILLHAITSYPTRPEHVNLLAMRAMSEAFPKLDVGYSDHTIGTTASICAAAMGARVIEKHFTLDKTADGPDHMLSADPSEMKAIVEAIRYCELARGTGIKRPADSERITRQNNRKSLVLARAVNEGELLTRAHLAIKRPGTGIQPRWHDQVIGRGVRREMAVDDVLTWDDLR